jgi:hypothetical protein
MLAEPSVTYFTLGLTTSTSAGLSKRNGNIFGNGEVLSVLGKFKIASWSSNVSIGESSTYRISSFLANGTRVTAAPTRLGEYRSQLRNAGADTFSDTNGTPAALPSIADGIRIYNGNAYSAIDTTSNPTYYDIFIGRNKSYQMQWYASAGRTGKINTSPVSTNATADLGYRESYDPTTGILNIQAHRFGGTTTTHDSGLSDGTARINDPYFDITVSENVLAVSSDNLSAYGQWAHDSTSSWTRTNTALGDPPADATSGFAAIGSPVGFASVVSATSGSDKLPGIVITPNNPGVFEVTARLTGWVGTATAESTFSLTDGSTVYDSGAIREAASSSGANHIATMSLSAIVPITSTTTLKIQMAATSGSVSVAAAGVSTQAITWTIKRVN